MSAGALRVLRAAAPPLVSVGLLAWIFSRVPGAELAGAFARARPEYLLVGLAISLVANTLLAAVKWRWIMRALGHGVTTREAVMYRAATQSFDFVMPKNSGGLALAAVLRRERGYPFARVLGTFVFDKALNFLAIVAYLLLGLAIAGAAPEHSGVQAVLAAAAGISAIFFVLLSPAARRVALAPARLVGGRFEGASRSLLATFEEIPLAQVAGLLVFSLVVQASDIATALLALAAFSVAAPLGETIVLLTVVVLIANVPVAASGIGTREAALMALFAAYGEPAALLGVGLAISFLEHLLPTLVGLAFVPDFVRRAAAAARSAA